MDGRQSWKAPQLCTLLQNKAQAYRDGIRENSACKARKLSDSMPQSPKKQEPERVSVDQGHLAATGR